LNKKISKINRAIFCRKNKARQKELNMLVMLEKANIFTAAREHGLSFEDLKKDGSPLQPYNYNNL